MKIARIHKQGPYHGPADMTPDGYNPEAWVIGKIETQFVGRMTLETFMARANLEGWKLAAAPPITDSYRCFSGVATIPEDAICFIREGARNSEYALLWDE